MISKIDQAELEQLRAFLATQRQPVTEETKPAPRPLITQQEFLAACVLASILLFFIMGN